MSLNKFEYDDSIILLTFRGKSEWKTVLTAPNKLLANKTELDDS